MTIERNLILVHQPYRQDVQDFYDIAGLVEEIAPDIKVYVAYNSSGNILTRKQASRLPTLVFSPGPLEEFRPGRGKIYAGRYMPKGEQMRRFAQAGLPVPPTAASSESMAAREDLGEVVIVKPEGENASRGFGLQLRRRSALAAELAAESGAVSGDFIVQKYVHTGRFPSNYRVHTLFGEPLLAFRKISTVAGAGTDASDPVLRESVLQARHSTGQRLALCMEDDVLALARRAHAALPEVPLQGCDIVREEETGALFLLEVNAGGNTWVFSKPIRDGVRRDLVLQQALGVHDIREPFDAFRTAARALIDKTRAEAQ